jgi:hypothetical protein
MMHHDLCMPEKTQVPYPWAQRWYRVRSLFWWMLKGASDVALYPKN